MDNGSVSILGIDIGKIISDAAKGVSDFFVKAGDDIVKAVDQNGDGILDGADIQTVIERNQEAQREGRRKADLERLKPIFPEEIEVSDQVKELIKKIFIIIPTQRLSLNEILNELNNILGN